MPCSVTYDPKLLSRSGGAHWPEKRLAIAAEKRTGGLKFDGLVSSHVCGDMLIHSVSSHGKKQSLGSMFQGILAV
jgi:hypothetical protein